MSPVGTSRRYRNVRFSGARRGSADISQRLPRGLAGSWLLNGRANFRDDALVRAKLDVAAYGLVLAVSGGGQEQSPGRFTRRKTCSCRLTAEIERNQDALAPELAREKEEIPVGTHAPIATKRNGCPLAPQLVAELAERGAGFRSLRDTWADSTTPHGKLMLTVLGGLAEFERSLMVARTSDGRKRAKDRGVRFGRPRKLTPHQRQEAIRRLSAGETQTDIARSFNVHHTTIGRLTTAGPFERVEAVQ